MRRITTYTSMVVRHIRNVTFTYARTMLGLGCMAASPSIGYSALLTLCDGLRSMVVRAGAVLLGGAVHGGDVRGLRAAGGADRKSTRLNSSHPV